MITSREIAHTVGTIMMARMTPAVSSEVPKIGPENSGTKPKCASKNGSARSRKTGDSTKRPHSPKTTLGTAASNSIKKLNGRATRRGAKSAR